MICVICTNCCREEMVTSRPEDDPNIALIESLCPKCHDELGAHEPGEDYYDNDGEWIEPLT